MARYPETNMVAVFHNRVSDCGSRTIVSYKNIYGKYIDISWSEMGEIVRKMGMYLLSRGIGPGDKVAIFSPNRYEWWVSDLAGLSAGAATAPIYATNSSEEARYIIDNSDSSMCFVGTKEHLDKILLVRDQLPALKEIVVFDEVEDLPSGVITFRDALAKGARSRQASKLEKRIASIDANDLATLVYTSGTTGNPKGVMLSHHNIFSNVTQCFTNVPRLLEEEHTLLSFLPLSHGFERIVGYYMAIYGLGKVVFSEGFDKILNNFQEVRPTLIVTVPRLFEKLHAGILAKVSSAPKHKQLLFNWAMDVARRNLPFVCEDRKKTGLFAIEYAIADRLVFSKMLEALGMDRLLTVSSGGGALSLSDCEFFIGMGIKMLEGYGLTEASPCTHTNTHSLIKPGTCGPPVKDTIAKTGEDGELLIKGPQTMMGYYKDEEATKEAFDDDGFLRTGDIATIDDDGYMTITGRIKDIIITSGGKNIAPQNIENSLKASRFIEQAAVIGEKRKFLSALIVPAFDELRNWADEFGLPYETNADLIKIEEIIGLFGVEIARQMKDYARVEQIRAFRIVDHEWSQETDELTPTLKVKRRVINEKYASLIEGMYS